MLFSVKSCLEMDAHLPGTTFDGRLVGGCPLAVIFPGSFYDVTVMKIVQLLALSPLTSAADRDLLRFRIYVPFATLRSVSDFGSIFLRGFILTCMRQHFGFRTSRHRFKQQVKSFFMIHEMF